MHKEQSYSDLCEELKLLKNAKPTPINYFEIKSNNWWKSIPAEIIPVTGGMGTQQQGDEDKRFTDELVKGKILSEIKFLELSSNNKNFTAVISSYKQNCGEIENYIQISIDQIADFNDDGIADLLLKGKRLERSNSCYLGSGRSLGGDIFVIVEKKSSTDNSKIIYKKTD
jgi:hypothetical protein